MKNIAVTIGLTLLSLCLHANAALVLDQNQPDSSVYMAGFSQPNLAQSFQQSGGNVAGAGIFLRENVGSSDSVTISLWDALPNQAGNMLASASGVATQGSWFDVFWNPVSVVSDTTLFLVFTSANDTLGISGSVSNPYDRGQVYANPGFASFPTFDYTFRTYSDDESATPSIPEPASVLLLGLGLVGIYFSKKRKSFH